MFVYSEDFEDYYDRESLEKHLIASFYNNPGRYADSEGLIEMNHVNVSLSYKEIKNEHFEDVLFSDFDNEYLEHFFYLKMYFICLVEF